MARLYTLQYTGEEVDTAIGGVGSLQDSVSDLINGNQAVGKAVADNSGNNIETTYATKQELSTKQPTGNYVTMDTEQTITATKNFGPINIVGDLNIEGNITQNGEQYETHAEQIYTADDYINMREGATAGLSQGQYSGFEIIKYNGINNARLVVDNTGTARVGDVGDEQPLATREETPINGGFARWSASLNSFITDNNVASTVILSVDSSRISDNIINLTDEEVTSLNIIPNTIFLKINYTASTYQSFYFVLNTQSNGVYQYVYPYVTLDNQITGMQLQLNLPQKLASFNTTNYNFSSIKVNNVVQTVVNFSSDPQTQLNSKYVKPSTGIPETDLSSGVQQKLNAGGGFTTEEIATLKALASKITVGDNVTFSTTVEAPVFNDLG